MSACFCELGYECISCARRRTGSRDIAGVADALRFLADPHTNPDGADECRDHADEWLADVADSGDTDFNTQTHERHDR